MIAMRRRKLLRLASLLAMLVFLTTTLLAQNRTITGRVTDNLGAGVQGVTVAVKGTNTATQTDNNGNFTITAPENGTLVFTSVGYVAREVGISGRTTLDVSMVNQTSALQEIVVIGYGTARRKDVTGSVASVTAKDFNKGIQQSPDQLIQGKVPGVQVLNNSGAPGAGVTVRIRGASSIRAGNQPLFVVDGVPLDNVSARPGLNFGSANGDFGQTPGGNPFNFINPNDIASIDVLKDASAAAIYGSRGANGVVLITTKKGASGAPRIEFNASAGISRLAKRLEVLSGAQYREGLAKYNLGTGADYGADVDALDEITETGFTQNYGAAIGQGNDNARYRFSVGYLNQEGIIRKSGFEKLSAALTSSFKFLESKRLGLDVNLLTTQTVEDIVPITNNAGAIGSLMGMALQWNPTLAFRKPDGSLNIDKGGDRVNPLAFSEAYNDQAKVTTVLASISPSFKLTNDLEYRFQYGLNYGTGNRKAYIKSFINLVNIQEDTAAKTLGGTATIGNNEFTNHQLTHTLSYVKDINTNLSVNAVAGFEYLKYDNNNNSVTGRRFQNVYPYYNFLEATDRANRDLTSFVAPTTELQSYFARGIFNFMDRYLLTATFRADGSSKFGENNKYGYFPSFAFAWNMGSEPFFQNSFASNMKLRLSWGKTGNQEFPAGVSQIQYNLTLTGAVQQTDANPDLQWEESTTANAGIDFTVLDNRINGTIDVFRKNTSKLLFPTISPDPQPAGTAVKWQNLDAEVINKGIEIGLNTSILRGANLTWDFGVNASFLDNEVRDLVGIIETGEISGQGLSGVRSQHIVAGQPLNVFYLKRFTGIDKATGISQYEGGEQRFYVGSPNPKTLLGINTRLGMNRLALEVALNGAFGHYVYNNTANAILSISNLGKRNVGVDVYNDAVTSGEGTANPIAPSTRYLEKGNYLKMTNATLSYRLGDVGPYFKGGNIFLTGQNLFVITDFTGFDPEVNTPKPYQDVPSFGIEYTPYPSPRIITLGVNFSL
jgi:TonB-linked SusC/RagA family outer membrane protein